MKLPIYKLIIDEFDDFTGISRISITDTPANLSKGFAFESINKDKPMSFNNQSKLRITSPMLVTDLPIYRKDEDGEYYVIFDEEQGELMYKKFLKNLDTTNVFNLKHTEQMVDGFLFETILLDDQKKLDFYNALFDSNMGLNSSVMTIQFNNQNDYINALANDYIGLSLEATLNMKKINFDNIDNMTSKQVIKDIENNKNKEVIMTEDKLKEVNERFESIENRMNQVVTMFEQFLKTTEPTETEEIDEVIDETEIELEDVTTEQVTEDNMTVLLETINELKDEIVKLKAKEEHFDKKEKTEKKVSFLENVKNTIKIRNL